MRWRRVHCVPLILVTAVAVPTATTGCASASPASFRTPIETPAPVDADVTQQGGLLNVARLVEVPGEIDIAGVAIDHAMPIGVTVLLALVVLLSHKREMRRIGKPRGNKSGSPLSSRQPHQSADNRADR